jgi:hypothetical protein
MPTSRLQRNLKTIKWIASSQSGCYLAQILAWKTIKRMPATLSDLAKSPTTLGEGLVQLPTLTGASKPTKAGETVLEELKKLFKENIIKATYTSPLGRL